jgi:hypothetical protein
VQLSKLQALQGAHAALETLLHRSAVVMPTLNSILSPDHSLLERQHVSEPATQTFIHTPLQGKLAAMTSSSQAWNLL